MKHLLSAIFRLFATKKCKQNTLSLIVIKNNPTGINVPYAGNLCLNYSTRQSDLTGCQITAIIAHVGEFQAASGYIPCM